MSDVPEGSGQAERGAGRRPPRVGDASSPVGSTLSIVLAVVAVVVGFLILRSVFEEDDGGAAPPGTTAAAGRSTTVPNTGTAETTAPPASTVPKNAATVVVANASDEGGTAGQMSTALEGRGYTMGEPTDATGDAIDTSRVLFVRGDGTARAVAELVAADMGGLRVAPIPRGGPSVTDGDIGNATVLVMLGTDLAGEALPAPAVSAPAPATGSATTTG